jgi:acetyl esterase
VSLITLPAATALSRDQAIARLDPELAVYAARPSADLTRCDLEQARQDAVAYTLALLGEPPVPPDVVPVAGHAGHPNVNVRVHMPQDRAPRLAMLHIHGGGMVKGSARAYDGAVAAQAAHLGALIASVDYRLAPETPFPGPLLDCAAAWRWLVDHAASLGIGQDHCIITGDSAGGGLAAGLCLYLRDTGAIMPAGQVLVFPMLDHRTGAGIEEADTRLGWNSRNNQFGWKALLGDHPLPEGAALGHYSPALAEDLSGLPPAWIGVGGLDLFLAENIAYAARIAASGGEVTLQTFPGAPHGFQAIPSGAGKRFVAAQRAAMARFSMR